MQPAAGEFRRVGVRGAAGLRRRRPAGAVGLVQPHAGADVGDSFDVFERIVAEHGGRPHWGKQHTLGVDELRRVHPRLDDFLAVRDRLDPTRVLVNHHLDHILGP
ncbi:hypothetical protein ET989_09380 [Propioniciclava sinopodophylli]|uniref:D-arabinono-1,4-lactone oxidase C-terminal domain-containing protein n=1 Tax=Propioniciclava sinopodophylli TaxID=1837344 RepID=A0A4Q9KD15_9ACTN|nr:hypothetical protein ET989_09380 [Propioniciclava sinopodophylli]